MFYVINLYGFRIFGLNSSKKKKTDLGNELERPKGPVDDTL